MLKKKYLIYVLLILCSILLICFAITVKNEVNIKKQSSKCMQNVYNFDSSSTFSINKIVYFSSANCDSNINSNSSFTISNLYQYTDIAIFINNNANRRF